MIELLLLALALSMDAFAVSIGLGAKYSLLVLKLAILSALYFGIFQGLMPLLGYLLGKSVLGMVADYAPWIACLILLVLGAKMIYEAWQYHLDSQSHQDSLTQTPYQKLDENQQMASLNHQADNSKSNQSGNSITQKTMITLAIATSIDAMAAGFTLNLMSINAYLSCLLIALVTAMLSFLGVFLGKQSGTWLESKAEFFGGLVLILIGLKMVIW